MAALLRYTAASMPQKAASANTPKTVAIKNSFIIETVEGYEVPVAYYLPLT